MGTTDQKTAEVHALSSTTHSNANLTTTTTTNATAMPTSTEAEVATTTTTTMTATPETLPMAKFQTKTSTQNEIKNNTTAAADDVGGKIVNCDQQQQQQQQPPPMQQINIDLQLARETPAQPPLIIPATQASTIATNAAKKIRRAFSLPRNPFRWSRKFKTTTGNDGGIDYRNGGGGGGGGTMGRSDCGSVTSHLAISSCVGGGRGRSGSILTLNTNDNEICKDTTNANTQIQEIPNVGDAQNQKLVVANGQEKKLETGTANSTGGGNQTRILRRSSFRKFLNRIAQHLNASVANVGSKQQQNYNTSNTTTTTTTTTAAATATTADRVPPISGYQWPADQTPGVMGLKNHGNTCFMNAVLQCLSHTDILAEYFVLDQYKVDLKRRNKINSRKFGTKGELTEQLANVLKALWTCKNESDHSTSFKAVVDRYGSQFRSSTQHDAQEFLFWLLDKVHEDLNTATKRRYKNVKNNYGRPDEIIAAETLANHIRCNNSFVQAVFQAQFRSSLTCPRCKKQSNTFDPFHCISVQLPQLTQQTIFVTVAYMKQQPRQVRLGLTVPAGSPIVALREQLKRDTGIASERMVLVDLNKEGFSRVFYDTQPVETLKGIESIYCIETPAIDNVGVPNGKDDSSSTTIKTIKTTEATTTTTQTAASKINDVDSNDEKRKITTATAPPTATTAAAHATDLLLLVANVHKQQIKQENIAADASVAVADQATKASEFSYELFGAPFSMTAPRDCSYTELQKKLLRELSAQLKPEVFSYAKPLTDMFQIRLQDPSADPVTYLDQVEHPLLTEMIDMALTVLSAEAGPPHIKLLLEWTAPEEYFIENLANSPDALVVEHESVARLSASKPNDTASLTLEQCLEHYTKAETLSAEDAWRCPHCQQYLPVVKTLGLWSLPDILVVHFKRFRQHHEKGPHSAKLTTMVKFPLNAFDMSPHLARGVNGENTLSGLDPTAASNANSNNYRPSPWKKSRTGDSRSSTLNSRSEQKDTRYDLYAVCYHQGDTLETGHYTAACKNPYDRQWYKFDDQRVSKVSDDAIQEEIINNEAYMLFYQRRNIDTIECSGSSSNSGDHWVSRIVPPQAAVPAINKEKDTERLEEQKSTCTELREENDEQLKQERPKNKPVEIPNLNAEVNEATTSVVKECLVMPQKPELVHIEEFDFVDIDCGDDISDLCATKSDALVKSTIADVIPKDIVADIGSAVGNQIFAMDEDCAMTDSESQHKFSLLDERKTIANADECQLLNSAMSAVDSVQVTHDGNLPPHDIKSHSASNTSTASSSTSSLSSGATPHSLAASVHAATTLQTKFNGYASARATAANKNSDGTHKEVQLSSSLKSHSGSINGTSVHEFQLTRQHLHNHNSHHHHHHHHHNNQHNNWHGSRSSVSAVENATTQQKQHTTHGLNLRHSFSTSSNYKLRECSETLSSLLRNSANTCSKDTLLFIDQQSHHHSRLIEDEDDTYMGRSLWISPVTPHKLITVSPKN